jgi:glyoxylase-like metal-dependent hydrolase (beta-lactamase superfamily II)
MKIGPLRVEPIYDGTIWLDGGAMFGIIPKKLWSKVTQPDEENRIRIGMYPLLLFTEPKILIDTGIGNKSDAKMQKIYRIDGGHLLDSLHTFNVTPQDIGMVINTHLHFYHAGGNTWHHHDNVNPTFPNAQYIIQQDEWNAVNALNELTQASYLKDNIEPLQDQVTLVDGDEEVLPGVTIIRTGGHTKGHQIVQITSGDSSGIYLGDLIPTTVHLPLPYIMAYDLNPLETLKLKKEVLTQAAKERWTLFFEHDPIIQSGTVIYQDDQYHLQ